VKNSLGLREARGNQNEGNKEVFENLSHKPFKTKNARFSRVTYSQSYSPKMHLKHKALRRKPLVAKVSV